MGLAISIIVVASYYLIYQLVYLFLGVLDMSAELDALRAQVASTVNTEAEASNLISASAGSVPASELVDLTNRLAASESALKATFPTPPTP